METLLEEFIRYGSSTLYVGKDVAYDIGYGDFIECKIAHIMTLPVPNDPNCPESGFRYTFHVALQAKDEKLNALLFNNTPVYKITPITDNNILVIPYIPDVDEDSVLLPEDFEDWDE